MSAKHNKGDVIKIGNEDYIVTEVITAGGTSICYKVTMDNCTYILKEYRDIKTAEARINHEIEIWEVINNKAQEKGNNSALVFESKKMPPVDGYVKYMRIRTEEGEALSDIEKKENVADRIKYAVETIIKTIDAVYEVCHKNNILHLDIKPANLYNNRGTIRLLDFGCSYNKEELNKKIQRIDDFKKYPICTGTEGFRSRRLQKMYEYINDGNEDKALGLLKEVSEKEDIFSIVQTFLYLLTGTEISALWEKDSEYGGYDKMGFIKKCLVDEQINLIYVDQIINIVKKADTEQYNDLNALKKDFMTLERIIYNKGFHEDVIIKRSIDKFNANIKARDFDIAEEILPYVSEERNVTQAVLQIVNSDIQTLRKNVFIKGDIGGMGKTISLWHLWRETLGITFDNKVKEYKKTESFKIDYVPIYVPLGLLGSNDHNLFSYIIENYIGKTESNNPHKELMDLFTEASKKYLLILDGLNEVHNKNIRENLSRDIEFISEKDNCYVIISSRNDDNQYKKFTECTINKLTKEQIREYCSHRMQAGDNYDIDSKLDIISTPMLLTLFVKTYANLAYEELDNTMINSEGELLEAYFDSQIAHAKDNKVISQVILNYVLPIVAIEQMTDGNTSALVTEEEMSSYIHKAYKYICDNDSLYETIKMISTSQDVYDSEKSIFLDIFNKKSLEILGEWLKKITVDDQHIFVREKEKYIYYHENYRDYFIARGFIILSDVDKEKFNNLVDRAVEGEMKYNSSAESYLSRITSMGRYRYLFDLKKKINEAAIKENIIILFKNIAYTYEEIQEREKDCFIVIMHVFQLIEKFSYIESTDYYIKNISEKDLSEQEIKTIIEKMDMISGLIYTFQQLPSKQRIITDDFIAREGIKDRKETFAFCLKKLQDALIVLEALPESLTVLLTRAKVNGNLGAHYLAIKGQKNVNTKKAIKTALDYHRKAYEIRLGIKGKYYQEEPKDKEEKKKKKELMLGIANSFTCFATDYFHLSNIVNKRKSIKLLEDSIEYHKEALRIRKTEDAMRNGENTMGIGGNSLLLITKTKGKLDDPYCIFIQSVEYLEETYCILKKYERKREIEKYINIIYERLTKAFDTLALKGKQRKEIQERCAKLADEAIKLFDEFKPFEKAVYKERELFRN